MTQAGVFGRHFLQHNQSQPVTSKETTDSDCCQWQNLSFCAKIRILGSFYQPLSIWQLPNTWSLSWLGWWWSSWCDFYNEEYRYLKYLNNSVKWVVHDVTNSYMYRRSFKVQVAATELNLSILSSLIWFLILHCN